MIKQPSLLDLLKSGVHFGHQTSKRHPKMTPFIFGVKSGVNVINLEQTQEKLKAALQFVADTVANGGNILFVGSKRQALPIVEKHAKECGMPYVRERWLGGTFTNFSELSKVIKKYNRLRKDKASGELEKYTKKEQLNLEREIQRLNRFVGGMSELDSLPQAVFIVDLRKEKTAFRESVRKGVPVVAICDTNINPTGVNYCIPGNDDAVKSIELFTSLIAAAVNEGKALAEKKKDQVPVKDKVAVKAPQKN
ncbi:30S ribosomal protein S2 [bacterium]|nr:30S ribosomal protein S2 [bacterium]